MTLLPRRNKVAVSVLGGVPLIACVLFYTIAALIEVTPQITVQWLYARRTEEDLPWQLTLSLDFSGVSLAFRVLLRLFLAILECQCMNEI